MKKQIISFCILFFIYINVHTQVLNLQKQANIIDEITNDRIENLLPILMKKNNIDCWIITSREYNEDPIIKTLLPATAFAARRRTIMVFYFNPEKKMYKKYVIARYNSGKAFTPRWDMEKFPNQWDALKDCIDSLKPNKIAVNFSNNYAHADGLHFSEYTALVNTFGKQHIISAEPLAVAWLETRTKKEMEIYPTLINITHEIIKQGFSRKVIIPGVTTAEDLEWWFRQKLADLNLQTWFHPSVNIQRNENKIFDHLNAFSGFDNAANVIQAGDLLHVDFGISYLRLNTDVQEHAYILKPNETEAPIELQEAFKKANQLQDILTNEFKEGKSGNEILQAALEKSKEQQLKATIYTHPIGYHGHAAGPTIGMWDNQGKTIGSGDYTMHLNTAYSIELNNAYFIKSWNKEIKIMLEQDGFFDETGFRYIHHRQNKLIIIN